MIDTKITNILIGLGFINEYEGMTGPTNANQFTRFRHNSAPKYDPKFALVVYHEYTLDTILANASLALFTLGKYMKQQELRELLNN
jgi:hypothetical protein